MAEMKHRTFTLMFGACAAVCLVALGLGLTQLDEFSALPAADRAQWVGALGSVFALLVAGMAAVGAAVHSGNLAREERAEEAIRVRAESDAKLLADRQAAVALMHMAAERLGGVARSLAEGGDAARVAVAAGPGALESTQRNLAAFPFWIIGDQHCVMQFAHVAGLIDLGINSCKALADLIQDRPAEQFPGPIQGVTQNLQQWERDIIQKANVLTANLGLPAYIPPQPR